MTPAELLEYTYGTDFPVWEAQPAYDQVAKLAVPTLLNLNKTYVPKYNKSPVDGRGYQLGIEPQDYVGMCVVSANRNATLISTAANDGYWCDISVEEMYGKVRANERMEKDIVQPKFSVKLPTTARQMLKGWVLKGKYPSADLRFADPAKALQWEKVSPPILPRPAKNKDIFRITTPEGIVRSLMAKRAVVFAMPWAWVRNDQYGRIQTIDLGGWHAMTMFGFANNYDKNLPGLWFMLMNSFRLKVMSGYDNPIASGRGTGLYQFGAKEWPDFKYQFWTSVGPMVKA